MIILLPLRDQFMYRLISCQTLVSLRVFFRLADRVIEFTNDFIGMWTPDIYSTEGPSPSERGRWVCGL
jgi:hypothetical protein